MHEIVLGGFGGQGVKVIAFPVEDPDAIHAILVAVAGSRELVGRPPPFASAYDRALWVPAHLARFLDGCGACRRRDAPPRLRPPADAIRRARLARDVLHDRDGTLADERDGHRLGAHAVACDAAGGVGGVEKATG